MDKRISEDSKRKWPSKRPARRALNRGGRRGAPTGGQGGRPAGARGTFLGEALPFVDKMVEL